MTEQPEQAVWIGLDVSKAWIDGAVAPEGPTWHVANDPGGRSQLVADLVSRARPGASCSRRRVASNATW